MRYSAWTSECYGDGDYRFSINLDHFDTELFNPLIGYFYDVSEGSSKYELHYLTY